MSEELIENIVVTIGCVLIFIVLGLIMVFLEEFGQILGAIWEGFWAFIIGFSIGAVLVGFWAAVIALVWEAGVMTFIWGAVVGGIVGGIISVFYDFSHY